MIDSDSINTTVKKTNILFVISFRNYRSVFQALPIILVYSRKEETETKAYQQEAQSSTPSTDVQ